MNTTSGGVVPEEPTSARAHVRFIAILMLASFAAGIVLAGRAVYWAAVDAWMAPINLSPENDMVLQLNVKVNEQLVQRDKFRSDVARIDVDLQAIDVSVEHLRTIQDDAKAAMRWSASASGAQTTALDEHLQSLQGQRKLLESMLARQKSVVERSERNVTAGLTSSVELDRDRLALDELELNLTQNARETSDTKAQLAQFNANTGAFRDVSTNQAPRRGMSSGLMPEVAVGQEREFRAKIELLRLEAERRALVAERALAQQSLERMDEIFKQLESRPLYRALQASTDVAFVPYTQLDGLRPGATIYACKFIVVGCNAVGHIAEILPGEVIATDPWSDVARGQYAILDLVDHEAAKEKVLRARP